MTTSLDNEVINNILSGRAIPSFKTIDYSSDKRRAELCEIKKAGEECIQRKKYSFNRFYINI